MLIIMKVSNWSLPQVLILLGKPETSLDVEALDQDLNSRKIKV